DGRCHQRLLDPGGATDRTGDMARSRKPVEGLGRLEPAFEGMFVAAGERVADHALPRGRPLSMWSERTGNQALRALRGEGGEDRAEFRLRHLSRGLRGPEPAPAALAPFGEVAPETGD